MKLQRRDFLRLAGCAAALPPVVRPAWAQAYPSRPVRFIVGYAAGGGIDLAARLMAQWLSDRLGHPFNVENILGAGTNKATETVVQAPADGYTLVLASAANAISATLYPDPKFDFTRDIAPVAGITRIPIVMVIKPSFPAQTIADFIAYAKANKTSIGSNFVGAAPYMAAALFRVMTGLNAVQVPYRSDDAAISALLDDKVQAHFAGAGPAIKGIKAGKIRALAVTTATRSEFLPEVPAIAESVRGYDASSWIGLGAPRNTPAEVIEKLNHEIGAGLDDSRVKARIKELGNERMPMSAAEFGRFVASETEKWGKVIRTANITPQ